MYKVPKNPKPRGCLMFFPLTCLGSLISIFIAGIIMAITDILGISMDSDSSIAAMFLAGFIISAGIVFRMNKRNKFK